MSKKFAVIALVLVVVCMLGVVAYADTVPLPEDYHCEMYYDEEGNRCFPRSCDYHPHIHQIGDRQVDENGEVYSICTDVYACYTQDGKLDGYIDGWDVLFFPSWEQDLEWHTGYWESDWYKEHKAELEAQPREEFILVPLG